MTEAERFYRAIEKAQAGAGFCLICFPDRFAGGCMRLARGWGLGFLDHIDAFVGIEPATLVYDEATITLGLGQAEKFERNYWLAVEEKPEGGGDGDGVVMTLAAGMGIMVSDLVSQMLSAKGFEHLTMH